MTANCFAAKDFCCHWAVGKSVDQIPVAGAGVIPVDVRRCRRISELIKISIKTNTYIKLMIAGVFGGAGNRL
jgi:hypothetical protein